MAQVTTVDMQDDLDGSRAAETVAFGVDGVEYEIDLSARNAKALRKALAEFVSAGRKRRSSPAPVVGGVRRRPPGPDAAVVRDWARQAGVPVSIRGRVSASVRAQYLAASSE